MEIRTGNLDPVAFSADMTGRYLVLGDEEYAYVVERDGDAWVEMQKLVPTGATANADFGWSVAVQVAILTDPLPANGDEFGLSVAIHGGYVAVGAPGDEQDLVNSGSVFIYQDLDPTGWTLLTKLRPPTPKPGLAFGSSLDLSADRVVVGSPYDNLRGVGAGAAHLFHSTASFGNTSCNSPRPNCWRAITSAAPLP